MPWKFLFFSAYDFQATVSSAQKRKMHPRRLSANRGLLGKVKTTVKKLCEEEVQLLLR